MIAPSLRKLLKPSASVRYRRRVSGKKATLTLDSKSKLDELIRSARARGQMNEIQVAVWSDNPVPRPNEQLSKTDRALAEQRAHN